MATVIIRANGLGRSPRLLSRIREWLHSPPSPAPVVQAARAPEPAPRPAAVATGNESLAEVLSPSQVNCFLECSAKWYFRYFVGLPEVKAANLALGRAIHHVAAVHFSEILNKRAGFTRELAIAEFERAWDGEAADTVFSADESPDDLKRMGAVLTGKFITEAAAEIKPAAVEQRVEGVIGGVKVKGYVDLLDTDGCVIDLKTAAKKPSGIKPGYKLQLATYRQITPGASGAAQLITLTKTKTPQLVRTKYTVTAADVAMCEKLYPLAQEGMRSGLYYPNRESMMCSRGCCSYWAQCEREFGGAVED